VAIQSEVQYAAVAAATGGDNTLVAAATSPNRRIRVLALTLVASGGANSARLESGASGTALTGVMDIIDNGQLTLPWNPAGWCQTAAGQLLNLELSAGTAVGGMLAYVTVE
jgi:hypothetical protein